MTKTIKITNTMTITKTMTITRKFREHPKSFLLVSNILLYADCTRSPGSTGYDDKSNCRTIWIIHYIGAKVIHSLPQKSNVFPELSCEEDHHRQWLFCSGKTLDMITPRCRYTPTQMTAWSLSFLKCLNPLNYQFFSYGSSSTL